LGIVESWLKFTVWYSCAATFLILLIQCIVFDILLLVNHNLYKLILLEKVDNGPLLENIESLEPR